NSNRARVFGRRSGTVTLIEEPVRRSAARNAQIVFWITWIVVGLLTATVTASMWHPVLALLAGLVFGLVVALVIAAFIVALPVIRAIWWWAAEIIAATALVGGWIQLAEHTTLPYRLGAVTLIGGVPAAVPMIRSRIAALAWCMITRHRIRACFSEFIITNRYG